ncbi:unnamed protein product [Blepharisma stoltei]|uniref:Homing endonuclease LAGLIDADG domain-containing protein n=1 Tax=Blepharisma stoltei TaxID=1481888 RepID=A0AAU9JLI8_9CILI|nr:unnamed protein product [Blepharisma stoltei]
MIEKYFFNIQGFIWIGNNGPTAGYRGSGGTGLLIHKSLANKINNIQSHNHRITAVIIENNLILTVYAPVVTNHQNDKSVDEYINLMTEIQKVILENQRNYKNDLPGKNFMKFIKDSGFFILNEKRYFYLQRKKQSYNHWLLYIKLIKQIKIQRSSTTKYRSHSDTNVPSNHNDSSKSKIYYPLI